MYTLSYVEWLEAPDGLGPTRRSHHLPIRRAERHASRATAMRRAREIIGASRISSVELIGDGAETSLDPWELAETLGYPPPAPPEL